MGGVNTREIVSDYSVTNIATQQTTEPSLDSLIRLVDADMKRVNQVIIDNMHSEVALIPQLASTTERRRKGQAKSEARNRAIQGQVSEVKRVEKQTRMDIRFKMPKSRFEPKMVGI